MVNVAIFRGNKHLKVLNYEIVYGDIDLNELVQRMLKSFGWNNEVCNKHLSD